jgi:hypothetical protein
MNASISVALEGDFHVSQSAMPAPSSTSNNSMPTSTSATATPRPAQGALHDIYVVHITTLLGERYFVKCHSQTLIHHLKKRMSNELLGNPAPWQQTWVLQQQTLLPCEATVGDIVKRLQLTSTAERSGWGMTSMGSSGSGCGNPTLEVQKVESEKRSDNSRHNNESSTTTSAMMALRDRDAPTRHLSPGPPSSGAIPSELVALDSNSKEVKMEAIFAPLPISPNLSTAHPINGTTTYTSSSTAMDRGATSSSTAGRRLSGSGTGQAPVPHHGTEHHLYVRVIRNMQTNGPALSSPDGAPTCEWCSRVVKPTPPPPPPTQPKARNGQQHSSSSNSHSGSDDDGKTGGKRNAKDKHTGDHDLAGAEQVPKRGSSSRLPGIPVVASENLFSSEGTGSGASLVNASIVTHSSSEAGSPMVPVATGSQIFNQAPPRDEREGLPSAGSHGSLKEQEPTPPAPAPPGNHPPRKLPPSMFHKRESPPELPNFLQVE